MKKIFCLFLSLIMCIIVCVPALATQVPPPNDNAFGKGFISTDDTVDNTHEEYLEGYLLLENGVCRRITQSELDELVVDDQIECQTFDESIMPYFDDIYIFNVENQNTKIYKNLSKAVSSWTEFGPGGGSFSVANQETFARTYSSNVSVQMQSGVTGTIGAAYSITNSRTIGTTLNVEGNRTARLRFAPECTRYTGNIEHRSWNYDYIDTITNVTVYQPTTSENGLFYLEYK